MILNKESNIGIKNFLVLSFAFIVILNFSHLAISMPHLLYNKEYQPPPSDHPTFDLYVAGFLIAGKSICKRW